MRAETHFATAVSPLAWDRFPTTDGADEIQIWQVRLDLSEASLAVGWSWLSLEEKQRAEAFRTEELRSRFVAAHGAVRYLLANELGTRPETLEFTETERGKPVLVTAEGRLHFNLAHSVDRMVLALSPFCPIGVDIEALGQGPIEDGLLETCLTPSEREFLLATSRDVQRDLFIRFWTAKEAVLKAEGSGFWIEPSQVEVELASDLLSGRAMIFADDKPSREFTVNALDVGPDFRAAVSAALPSNQG